MADIQPGYIVFGTGDPSYVATLSGNNTYTGKATFKPATDDIGIFEVQDKSGTQVFRVDTVNKWVIVGDRDATDFDPQIAFYVAGDYDGYYGVNVNNISDGTTASADIVGANDTETSYVDLGITSSTNNDVTYPILQAGVGYVYSFDTDLVVGGGADLVLFAGGFAAANIGATLAGTGGWTFSQVLKTAGRKYATTTKTADYTATTTDEVIICNKATAMTITLPAASGSGQVYAIKNINTGAVTVSKSGDTIDGASSQLLNQYDSLVVVDYAANAWAIL